MTSLSYFAYIGSFYLAILTYQNYSNKLTFINNGLNYFMLGITFSLLSHIKLNIIYLISMILIAIAFNIVLKRMKVSPEIITTITWILYGFAIINAEYTLVFFVLLTFAVSFTYFLKKIVFRYSLPTPIYPIITIIFISCCIIFNLFS